MTMTIAFQPKTLTTISAASSPEEAYKIFAGAATQLIAKAIADALGQAVGAVSAHTKSVPAVTGWEGYLSGLTMDMCWGTPGYKTPPSLVNCFEGGTVTDPAAPAHVMGIGFSVGITGSF